MSQIVMNNETPAVGYPKLLSAPTDATPAPHVLTAPPAQASHVEQKPTEDQNRTYPFHDPLPLSDAVFSEEAQISSDHMYTLLQSPKPNASLEQLARDPSVPILAFTGKLYREIRYITEKNAHSEYAVFLLLKRIDENRPHFLAFDFFMPGQTASGGGVSLNAKDCSKYFERLKEVDYYKQNGLQRHICHLHSHASFGTFWSSVDDTQQLTREDLGFMDAWRFYVVVNAKGDIKCSFVTYKPVLQRVDAAVALSYAEPEHIAYFSRKRRAEVDKILDDCLKTSSYSYPAVGFPDAGRDQAAGLANWGYDGDWCWKGRKSAENVRKVVTSSSLIGDGDKALLAFKEAIGDYTPNDALLTEWFTADARRDFTAAARIAPASKIAPVILAWMMECVLDGQAQEYGEAFGVPDDIGTTLGVYMGELLSILHGEIGTAKEFAEQCAMVDSSVYQAILMASQDKDKAKVRPIEAIANDLSSGVMDTVTEDLVTEQEGDPEADAWEIGSAFDGRRSRARIRADRVQAEKQNG